MDKLIGKITVIFEDPFWVGIFERIDNGKLSVTKVTFGAEPKDYEVLEHKLEKKVISKEKKEAEKQRQFELKRQKRKDKHRGK